MTQELRRNPRVLLDVDVEIEQGGARLSGRVHDISLGGIFLRCAPGIAFGSEVTLHFKIPTSDQKLALSGLVRWLRDDGIGVQFFSFGVRETFAITEWVKRQTTT